MGAVIRDGHHYLVADAPQPTHGCFAAKLFNPHEVLREHAGKVNEWLAQLRTLVRFRPAEQEKWHQRHVTLRTSLLRAFYLHYRGDIQKKTVVLLGDSDLTSLALCILGGFLYLHVLEADPRVVDFLERSIGELNVENAEVRSYNAYEAVPGDLRGAMDTLMCDPSRRLYRTFFASGVELLKPSGVFYTFVNPSHSDSVGQFIFQRDAIQQGWILTDSIPVFNEYQRRPGSLPDELQEFYPAPDNDEDNISFTETMVRFIQGPSAEAEALVRRTKHERHE